MQQTYAQRGACYVADTHLRVYMYVFVYHEWPWLSLYELILHSQQQSILSRCVIERCQTIKNVSVVCGVVGFPAERCSQKHGVFFSIFSSLDMRYDSCISINARAKQYAYCSIRLWMTNSEAAYFEFRLPSLNAVHRIYVIDSSDEITFAIVLRNLWNSIMDLFLQTISMGEFWRLASELPVLDQKKKVIFSSKRYGYWLPCRIRKFSPHRAQTSIALSKVRRW